MNSIIVISSYVVLFKSIIEPISCVGERYLKDVSNRTKLYTRWDDEKKIKLLRIFYETNTGERFHRERIKKRWDELHAMRMPHSGHNLYKRARSWIEKGEAGRLLNGEERQYRNPKTRKPNMKWTSEMREDILRFFDEVYSEKGKRLKTMKELWDEKYPQYPEVTGQRLMVRVRELQKMKGEVADPIRPLLTIEEKKDLLRCYNRAPDVKNERIKVMRALFIAKHPQFANVSHETLRRQALNIRYRGPAIDEEILSGVSALDNVRHSWEPGEASGTKRDESTFNPTFQNNSQRKLDHYPGPNHDNPWYHHDIIRGPSSASYHTSFDVATSQQIIIPGHNEDHSGRNSAQHHSDKRLRDCSEGEGPALDLNLHL